MPEDGAEDLEGALLDDVRRLLDRWGSEFAGRPDLERRKLVLLSLEREQVVAVAYREEAVVGRVAALDIDEDARAAIRQTLVWIWKDEQLHAEYVRGWLLRSPGIAARVVVYGRQLQGAPFGVDVRDLKITRTPVPRAFRAGAAGLLVALGAATGQVPPVLRRELRYQTFRHYCRLNAALEASAELGYKRLAELCGDPGNAVTFERIRNDEARHGEAFRALANALTDDDRLSGPGGADLAARLAAISVWFVPARLRPASHPGAPNSALVQISLSR